jgi:hypothetical protein
VVICPDKTVNPYAWMRGKRAYEIAVATLREPEASSAPSTQAPTTP